jgi:uncharacterized delta-60 repeat protein
VGYAQKIVIQPDDKILMTGATPYNNSGYMDVAARRYLSGGGIDNTFNGGNMVKIDFNGDNDIGNTILLQPDGKILISAETFDNYYSEIGVLRLNNDGSPDNSFDTDGKVIPGAGTSPDQYSSNMYLQSDNKILIAGSIGDYSVTSMIVLKLNSDGTSDNSFGTQGISIINPTGSGEDIGYAMTLQNDGKILLCGKISTGGQSDLAIFRLLNSVATAVKDISNPLKAVLITPNPVTDNLNIFASHMPTGKYQINVSAADGRLVESKVFTVNSGVLQYTINTSKWPAGTVIVTIIKDHYNSSYRIIKL